MKLPKYLPLIAASVLTACSSSPSSHPVQGITSPSQEVGYPTRGIGSPHMGTDPFEVDDELLEKQNQINDLTHPDLAE